MPEANPVIVCISAVDKALTSMNVAPFAEYLDGKVSQELSFCCIEINSGRSTEWEVQALSFLYHWNQ